jgi:nucleotide-binding universal stress UspA family protein
MTTILLATDFSNDAVTAEDLIESIRWPASTHVRVVNVQPDMASEAVSMPLGPNGAVLAPTVPATVHECDAIVRRVAEHGLDASTVICIGDPARAIVDLAVEEAADLIVIGRSGVGAMSSSGVLGSQAQWIVDHAPCPVLVARRPQVRTSVVALDGSRRSDRAFEYVRERPNLLGSNVTLVEATNAEETWAETIDLPIDTHQTAAIAEGHQLAEPELLADLEEKADVLRGCGCGCHVTRIEGPASAVLLEVVDRTDADLVVLGARRTAPALPMALGAVGRHLLLGARCSVLIVGEDAAAAAT